jgi:RelA/SpoT family (p)ppGpp synthetase
LEDLGFRALYPYRYKVLERELKRARGNQKEFVGKIAETFKGALKKAQIAGGVEGREKHLYSIYRKMQTKHISINEMVDVYGFRIIVDNPDTCYRALGLVHSVHKPMPGRFKDYIAIPRVNGYQSLHTTLFGPNGVPIEVQIRSEQMHRVAESGIAAHWKYKSGGDSFGGVEHDRAREWLASLVQIQEGGSSEEFLESVKVDLFPDKVYVFTPKGKILRLPTGATAVDFAYAIHTDIGNRCVAAKVDRRLVPLRTPLRNGQTVEIITAKGATPNPSWSSFLVTAKARAAIRQYLKNLKRGEALELGRRLLGLALEEFSLSLKKVAPADLNAVVKELNLRDADELFEKIGLGERLAPLVARRLQPAREDAEQSAASSGPLMIAGTEGLLVTYARCCFPIPNDPIMAYLSAGRGVMIHRQNCGNLAEYRKQPEKWLSVAWEETHGRLFTSEIQLEINNRVGVLAAVALSIAEGETNIDQVQLEERDVSNSWLRIQLQVRDRHHLAQVIKTIRRMPDVQRVFRTLA